MRLVGAAEIDQVISYQLAREAVAHALEEHRAGRTSTSRPPLLQLDTGDGGTLQAKAASVGRVAGVRLAGELDGRHVDEGRRLLLYDTDTMTPRAWLDEVNLYRYRVGAQVALTVDRLASAHSSELVVVGAGRLARAVIGAIQAVRSMVRIGIHSRTTASSARAVEELAASVDASVWSVEDLPAALGAADVIVTVSTASAPVVAGRHLSSGTLVVSAGGGWECDEEVYARADRLFVDDWEHCTQVGDLAELTRRDVVVRDDVTACLAEAIGSDAIERCRPDEVVVAVPQGMTISDIALASRVLDDLEQREARS